MTICVCMYIYIYIYTYTTYNTYTLVCTYIYIYIYTHVNNHISITNHNIDNKNSNTQQPTVMAAPAKTLRPAVGIRPISLLRVWISEGLTQA